ncbi:unnamed protein product [Trichogramma brassicae]|uniref:Uncharacterized protein n=1 Tax=Trichogramma brassicae TaxID=86971 RepID=A0A6H5IWM5_9HYME|nr:unnamed protein product [Trichogramma brassicae]
MSNRGRRRNRMANDSLTELIQLKNTANLTTTEGRLQFLQRLYPIIENWHGRSPDLRRLFQAEEIEELLVLDFDENEYFRRRVPFVNFVTGFGYTYRARLDASGRPILQRTTPIHLVARRASFCFTSALYKIYQPRFNDSNYRDESGFTHFHAACKFGFHWVVWEFLVFGRIDPDLVVDATGDRPLHLAIQHEHKGVVRQLLHAGADPNPANEAGETPLHLACGKNDDGAWARMLLLESQQSRGPLLRIDARAVRLAVTSLQSRLLVELLRRGFAGWNGFVFPEAQEFADVFAESRGEDRFAVRLAAGALGIYRIYENHGHNRGAALTILKAFDDHGLLERSARAVTSRRLELKEASSRIERDRKLEFHDLIRLRPSDAVRKLVSSSQYYKLAYSRKLWMLPERLWEPCSLYLCEIMMRSICLRWALDSFIRKIQYELPFVCCQKIIDNMTARDMYHICLAADL